MKGNEVKWGKQVVNRRAVVPEGAWHTWVAQAESGPVQYLVWLSVRLKGPGLEGTIVWLVLGRCAVPRWLGTAVTSKQGHGKVCSALEAGEQECSCAESLWVSVQLVTFTAGKYGWPSRLMIISVFPLKPIAEVWSNWKDDVNCSET